MIGKDMTHRWYDLVPETLNAHAPAWGKLPRSTFDLQSGAENLAKTALLQVDSFYGTVNTSDRRFLYSALNQVEITWIQEHREKIDLRLTTVTPCFSHFSWRFDSEAWNEGVRFSFNWLLHEGTNTFEVCSVNRAGKAGRISRLTVMMKDGVGRVEGCENGSANDGSIEYLWEDFTHPTLTRLREKYRLDEVLAPAANDLERVRLLRDWLKARWDHDQPIVSPPWDAEYLLDHTDQKIEAFYCVHYSVAYMQLCLAMGIPARLVNLHRGICRTPFESRGYGRELDPDHPCDEHVLNEVWLDDLGKWVVMDVDFDIDYQREGVPLNGVEIHDLLIGDRLNELTPCEGPYAYKLRANDGFYQFALPVYYTHFCLFWRNNHLSDPQGPTRIMHWVDEKTPPMLWWEGEDLRHRPQIIGPIGISWPYTDSTPVLTDQNMATCWASSEEPGPHWVALNWEKPQHIHQVQILWANCWGHYYNSRNYEIQAWLGDDWVTVAKGAANGEKAEDIVATGDLETEKIRLYQPLHGGSQKFPDRLWVAELAIY